MYLLRLTCTPDVEARTHLALSGRPPMGSLALSMPPVVRDGKSATSNGIPTSQLLGGSSEEDMILGQQISTRLAKRVGWPIFVSCSFSGWGGDSGGGGAAAGGEGGGAMDVMSSPSMSSGYDDMLPMKAASLAEKEVARILLEAKGRIESASS